MAAEKIHTQEPQSEKIAGVAKLPYVDFQEIETLIGEIEAAAPKKEVQPQLTVQSFSRWMYDQYAGVRRDPLERIPQQYLSYVLPTHQSELLGRLNNMRAINLKSLEVTPVFEEQGKEETGLEEQVQIVLGKIEEEKIQPIQRRLAKIVDADSPQGYFELAELNQQLSALRVMFDGVLATSDRRLFDNFTNPEVGEQFFDLKREASELLYRCRDQKSEWTGEVLPVEQTLEKVRSGTPSAEGIVQTAKEVRDELSRLIVSRFSENPNQQYLLEQLYRDTLAILKDDPGLDREDQFKILLLGLPQRFSGWYDYKMLARRNPNYTGSGITNIALADNFIRHVTAEEPFELAKDILGHKELISEPIEEGAEKYFLGEVELIYDSRRSIERVLSSLKGESELLLPAEAMHEVSELTYHMNQGDVEAVLGVVERLEGRTIDLYHETADRHSFESILEEGKLYSSWAQGHYGDTFFGGGIYFWGAQQEDWMKGGPEAIHTIAPVKDLFIIRNKYNNPNKGPFSSMARYLRYTQEGYPHSQKKYNLICMIPAFALGIKKWNESEERPLSNEGYTAETIADVEDYSIDEANFIWRIDKHYGHYDTEYFIGPEKEELLKRFLGESVRVERNVTTPGFIGGEYDRLILSSNISVLKATSLAYTLRIPEVVYADRLDALHQEEQAREKELLQAYQEATEALLYKRNPDIVSFIDSIAGREGLSEKDRVLIRYFLSELDDETLQSFKSELVFIKEAIGQDLPTKMHFEKFIPKQEWFIRDSKIHGTPHIIRVLLNIELLARLAQKEITTETKVNLEALEVAAGMHDVKRSNDRATDMWHGKRAAEFLQENTNIFPEIDPETRDLAYKIMNNHCLDDHENMFLEETIFKDADALDRFRFSSGPDWRYMRLASSKEIVNTAYAVATLSNFFLNNGYRRDEAVIKSAEALALLQ